MLPDPLHPAVVHFPVVLAVLIPLVAAGSLWAIRQGSRPLRAWGVTTAVAALLALSAWVSVETGEQQEERVEDVVGEARMEQHAAAGERLLFTSAGVLVVIALGLMPGTAGRVARYVGVAGTLGVAAMAFQVGRSGGELVYRHNAASAYAPDSTGAPKGAGAEGRKEGAEKAEEAEKGESAEKGDR